MAVSLGVGQLCVLIALAAAFMGIDKGTYSYISPLQVVQTAYLFLFCRSLTVTRGEKIITFSLHLLLLLVCWLILGKEQNCMVWVCLGYLLSCLFLLFLQ